MESLRRLIAAFIIAAGLAAPVFSCPVAARRGACSSEGAGAAPAGCGMAAAQDGLPPCHKAAAPAKKQDCDSMLCCRPDFQDRMSADRLELRPSWQIVAAVSVELPAEAVRPVRAPAGRDPPPGLQTAFLHERPSRAPPVLA